MASDVAFANDMERAHYNTMRGRLDAMVHVHQHLGAAMETLRLTYMSIGTEVQELSDYVSTLAPAAAGFRETRHGDVGIPSGSFSVKAFVMKLRVRGLSLFLPHSAEHITLVHGESPKALRGDGLPSP